MKSRQMSPSLAAELESRIASLEQEDRYVKDIFKSINYGGVSSVADNKTSDQKGTLVPVYFGAIDTFVANPSNVGIGILARMIETDPTVLSAVQFKSLMMLSKVGEYQNAKNPEIQDFVRRFLKRMDAPNWKKSLEAQSSAGGYGFSTSEIMWGLNNKNQKVPWKIKTYHPSTICFELDPYGDVTPEGVIQFVVQHAQISNPNNYFPFFQSGFLVRNPFETPTDRLLPYRMPFINNYGIVRIPKNKVIHHTNNSMLSFGSPYGKTSVRTAHLAWQLKVFFMKQMGIGGKRQASPFLWGTAPFNQNKVRIKDKDGKQVDVNPIDALTDILARREGDDAVVTGPEVMGYKITAIASQMDLNQFLAVLNWLDVQIFRGFLLPSLVMTDGSAGSRALGDKHFQIVDRIAEEEACNFSETIISQMIKPAIDMNFGEQDDYGHFAQRPQSIEERERLANMFTNLGNAGWMRPFDQKDGDYVRSTLHLPEQEESFYTEPMPNMPGMDEENPPPDDDGGGEDKKDKSELSHARFTSLKEKGKWITINDTRVQIDEDGKVVSGPESTKGEKFPDAEHKPVDELPKKSSDKKPKGDKTPAPKEEPKKASPKEKTTKQSEPDKDEARAIRSYSTASSSQFIEADRGGEVPAEIKEKNEKLNDYLDRAPKYEGTLYRGIAVEKGEVKDILDKYKEGAKFDLDAKQSWTKEESVAHNRIKEVARHREEPVKITFEYPGSKAGVDVSSHSNFEEEKEVIVPKGAKYKVKDVKKSDDGYKIIFEESE